MEKDILDKLTSIEDVRVESEGDLSLHTGFRTGGRAVIVRPFNKSAFINVVTFLKRSEIKYYILGNGSNVLAKDDGYDGVVVLTRDALSSIDVHENTIIAGAGSTLLELCTAALNNELTGLEFAYGIPGSVGGAVYMNAGAYGGEIKDVIASAEFLDENGYIRKLNAEEIRLGYRTSIFQKNRDWTILAASFRLSPGIRSEIHGQMLDLLNRRKEKQPLEYPSCGSTFKRPKGNYASKLIDDCGFRGFSLGGAQVSEKHCGFVINRDNATTEDILQLVEIIRDTVREKTGYNLELEVEILE